ncbi:hypothetical protein ACF09E_00345 [Streptomyces sp. NPDC014891]|uniref:hypothetical protein n=1 Tax=Streptomyces sp. NPDC014891 TaxID=3364929 RepID=UPI0036F6FE10
MVPDYAGMDSVVADLVLPAGAPMHVMSTLETSRELIRHSYYRYEFATVAVTHSLVALEHVLTERSAVREPLEALVERAAEAGLFPADLAAELHRGRLLRDELVQGTRTSAAVGPLGAFLLVRAVFRAVSLVLGPSSAAEAAAADPTGSRPEDRLALLWEEHLRAPYPDSFRGVAVGGVELVLLDADVAGLVQCELHGVLDDAGVATLWACIADLDKAVPLIDSEYCGAYFARLRTMAGLVSARHVPAAT